MKALIVPYIDDIDYMQYYIFSKVEGKKIINHAKFEEVVQKYW